MTDEQKKYPVWRIDSDWTPDQLRWIIPVSPIKELPRFGGGQDDLFSFLDGCLDGVNLEDAWLDCESLKITVGFMTLEQLQEVYVHD